MHNRPERAAFASAVIKFQILKKIIMIILSDVSRQIGVTKDIIEPKIMKLDKCSLLPATVIQISLIMKTRSKLYSRKCIKLSINSENQLNFSKMTFKKVLASGDPIHNPKLVC